MKTLITLLLITLALVFSGCSGESGPVGPSDISTDLPPDFDANTYLSINTDLVQIFCDGVTCDYEAASQHYLTSGSAEGRPYLFSEEICNDGYDNDGIGGDKVCVVEQSSSSVIVTPSSSSIVDPPSSSSIVNPSVSSSTAKGIECLTGGSGDCKNANLEGANIVGNSIYADFSDANLNNSSWEGSISPSAVFKSASICGADFSKVLNITEVEFNIVQNVKDFSSCPIPPIGVSYH